MDSLNKNNLTQSTPSPPSNQPTPPAILNYDNTKSKTKQLSSSIKTAKPSTTNFSCFITIWSTWYCLIIVALHVFLLRNHILNLISLFRYYLNLMNKFNNQKQQPSSNNVSDTENLNDVLLINITILKEEVYLELISRLCMILVSILFLVLFILTSLCKCENYANDFFKFGRDFFKEKGIHKHYLSELSGVGNQEEMLLGQQDDTASLDTTCSNATSLDESKKKKLSCYRLVVKPINKLFRILWRHFLTISSFCHLISILSLLITDIVFQTNLNKLINHNKCSLPSSFAASANQGQATLNYLSLNSFQNLTSPTSCHLLNLITYLTKANLMQSNNDNSFIYDASVLLDQIDIYKFELISLISCLATLYTRYGSVFWYTNKSLAFLISFIGYIASIEQILQLYSFVYISKQLQFSNLLAEVRRSLNTSVTTQQGVTDTSNTNFNDLTLLIRNKFILLFLFAILSIFVYLSATPAYVFTYFKYKERFYIEESLFKRSIQTSTSTKPSKESDLILLRKQQINSCCFSYCPHLIATIQLIIICSCKLPFCYDYIIYFNNYKDLGVMLCIIVEIMHTIILLFIWLALTLKIDWNMHLQTTYSICHWTYHVKMNENKIKKVTMIVHSKEEMGVNQLEKTKQEYKSSQSVMDNASKIYYGREEFDVSQGVINNTNSVLIRNKPTSNIYNQVKHKSLHLGENENYMALSQHHQQQLANKHQSVNLETAITTSPINSLDDSASLYRDKIRRSMINVLPHNKSNNQVNYSKQSKRICYTNTSNANKRLVSSGIYLTSTSSANMAAVNAIQSSSDHSFKQSMGPAYLNQKKTTVVCLDNHNCPSNEYESRV